MYLTEDLLMEPRDEPENDSQRGVASSELEFELTVSSYTL